MKRDVPHGIGLRPLSYLNRLTGKIVDTLTRAGLLPTGSAHVEADIAALRSSIEARQQK